MSDVQLPAYVAGGRRWRVRFMLRCRLRGAHTGRRHVTSIAEVRGLDQKERYRVRGAVLVVYGRGDGGWGGDADVGSDGAAVFVRASRACLRLRSGGPAVRRVVALKTRDRQGEPGSRGTPGGDARGRSPLARRRPSSPETIENFFFFPPPPPPPCVSKARTACRMPPHQPAGITNRAWAPQRRSHKGTSVAYPGSSGKRLRRQGVARLTPAAVALTV